MVSFADSESRDRSLLYKAGRQALMHSVTVRLNVGMGKTSDLGYFEHSMIVGGTPFQYLKPPAFWAFHARQCLGFTENGATNKKHPVSGSHVGKNPLMGKVKWQELCKLTGGPQTGK
jgi:hypothetical protein